MNMFLSIPLLFLTSFLSNGQWKDVSFDNIPPNRTDFSHSGITIHVNSTASPMVHLLPEKRQFGKVVVSGKIEGKLNVPPERVWQEGFDDSYLRFGVIEEGNKRLNDLQKLSAPGWLRRMDRILDQGDNEGISRIHTFCVMPRGTKQGIERIRRDVAVFEEVVAATPEPDGTFRIEVAFPEPVSTVGLWILADGDDTGSRFSVSIHSINCLP